MITYNIGDKQFVVLRYPPVEGRKIICAHTLNIIDIMQDKERLLEITSFITVNISGQLIELSTEAMVDNHVLSKQSLYELVWASLMLNAPEFEPFDNTITAKQKFIQSAQALLDRQLDEVLNVSR